MSPSTQQSPRSSLDSPSSPVHRDEGINTLGERSTSTLVLVHDAQEPLDDEDYEPLSFANEAEHTNVVENDESDATALAPSVVFGHLLAPSLKLGAMLILSGQADLKVSIPSLVLFALLSAFARQIWFLLARYVRRPDVGSMVSEAFARGPRREGTRQLLRAISNFGSSVTRLLLSAVYLRGALTPHKYKLLCLSNGTEFRSVG